MLRCVAIGGVIVVFIACNITCLSHQLKATDDEDEEETDEGEDTATDENVNIDDSEVEVYSFDESLSIEKPKDIDVRLNDKEPSLTLIRRNNDNFMFSGSNGHAARRDASAVGNGQSGIALGPQITSQTSQMNGLYW